MMDIMVPPTRSIINDPSLIQSPQFINMLYTCRIADSPACAGLNLGDGPNVNKGKTFLPGHSWSAHKLWKRCPGGPLDIGALRVALRKRLQTTKVGTPAVGPLHNRFTPIRLAGEWTGIAGHARD